jgi:hypothetical protein
MSVRPTRQESNIDVRQDPPRPVPGRYGSRAATSRAGRLPCGDPGSGVSLSAKNTRCEGKPSRLNRTGCARLTRPTAWDLAYDSCGQGTISLNAELNSRVPLASLNKAYYSWSTEQN